MSEVKRYVFTWSETRGGYNCPDASAAGLPLVLASDYAALQAERDGLVRALRELIREFDDMDEHRPLHAGCVQCTEGATPDRYNTGPCAYHQARTALAALEGK